MDITGVECIHFNTGCHYTKHGQRITACDAGVEGYTLFIDHDRMICGYIPLPFDDKMTAQQVDWSYLFDKYETYLDEADNQLRYSLEKYYGNDDRIHLFKPYIRPTWW